MTTKSYIIWGTVLVVASMLHFFPHWLGGIPLLTGLIFLFIGIVRKLK